MIEPSWKRLVNLIGGTSFNLVKDSEDEYLMMSVFFLWRKKAVTLSPNLFISTPTRE